MPLGTGTDVMLNVPSVPFTPNPGQFDVLTSRNNQHNISFTDPGPGGVVTKELPKAGILTWARLTFQGQAVVALGGGTCTPRWPWPYGLIDEVALTANTNNGLINASGVDLHVHRFLRNPSFVDGTDTFPSSVGGGDALTSATHPITLTWDLPIVADRTTLAGCIFAQSTQNSLQVTLKEASQATLFDLTGAATVTITGTWSISLETYEIPKDPEAGLITPDLSRLHSLQARDQSFAAAGDVPIDLLQSNGQLLRLLIQTRGDADSWLSAIRSTVTPDIDSYRLTYGTNQTPYDFLAHDLAALNNEHYGAPLPYGYVALDWVKVSAVRDAVYMPGLTDLKVVPVVTSDATIDANAKVRVVYEVLFQ